MGLDPTKAWFRCRMLVACLSETAEGFQWTNCRPEGWMVEGPNPHGAVRRRQPHVPQPSN
eukprot:CAMPEP_0174296160 /NCGR_PEP_ID=MMETSP0809-20121228/47054_1 /TAXON_ID=73025 ORGANISM="Eutreptiella gymnastica-like, Strain CCMP1594" /NCGR_SAMPLE_ID=MMETSP0809 /ASSEMBLY_ACC=CAM_ASM_000658 /LENGTH=59 /DNA_ID=CAMNT_0015398963 /DNA_START=691 /DNA_END=870 /DNA_ORIENTATION=-